MITIGQRAFLRGSDLDGQSHTAIDGQAREVILSEEEFQRLRNAWSEAISQRERLCKQRTHRRPTALRFGFGWAKTFERWMGWVSESYFHRHKQRTS